jgi:hypothetical protein
MADVDAALRVHLRITNEPRPATAVPLLRAHPLEEGIAHVRRIARVHVHNANTASERELHHVRLATAAARERLVVQDLCAWVGSGRSFAGTKNHSPWLDGSMEEQPAVSALRPSPPKEIDAERYLAL